MPPRRSSVRTHASTQLLYMYERQIRSSQPSPAAKSLIQPRQLVASAHLWRLCRIVRHVVHLPRHNRCIISRLGASLSASPRTARLRSVCGSPTAPECRKLKIFRQGACAGCQKGAIIAFFADDADKTTQQTAAAVESGKSSDRSLKINSR